MSLHKHNVLSDFWGYISLGFRDFIETIIGMGGKWITDDVYFKETAQKYVAHYMPYYPNTSSEDDMVALVKADHTWQFAGKYA